MASEKFDKKEEMSGFKLLAIVPLEGCKREYRKGLENGQVYQFYKNYDIRTSADNEKVIWAKANKSLVPKGFFDLDNGIKLNISTVVGQNGSGKSTLSELLYYLIYQVFINLKVNNEYILEPKSKEIQQRISNLTKDIRIEKIENFLNKGIKYDDSIELRISELITEYKLYSLRSSNKTGEELQKELIKQLHDVKKTLKIELEEELNYQAQVAKDLAVALLFEKEGEIFELEYSNEKFFYSSFKNGIKQSLNFDSLNLDELSGLFYTISINYSAHSLNSLNIGNWISRLFHKNDAYLTPIVINPMRTNGNYDVNREIHLSKERLLSNIIYDYLNESEYLILDKYKVETIEFTVKKNYRFIQPIDYSEDYFIETIVGKLIKSYINREVIQLLGIHGQALAYLDKKVEKIKVNYGFLIFGKDLDDSEND